MKSGEPTRPYRQTSRADAAERTRLSILAAVFDLSSEIPLAAITLGNVAERAGVTVQTVLRRFGSRQDLFEQALDHYATAVREQRLVTSDDDPREAVRIVVEHYESFGDRMLLLLGQEATDPMARRITDDGRRFHEQWVEDAFCPRSAREHRLLIVATDLYTWKLLRRDRRLSATETAEHMHDLCCAITARAPGGDDG